jgi:Cys-tRNA(Pro) deacylase
MSRAKYPVTPAIRMLREHNIEFRPMMYRYVEHGGTEVAARELGLDEHTVIKTLVMEDSTGDPLIILMHGDREVSTKNLARAVGSKEVQPCDAQSALRHTGYRVGGISPFGIRKPIPVYIEESILALPEIYINGGHRGLLVAVNPEVVSALADGKTVSVTR